MADVFTVRNLSAGYGRKTVLRNLSFSVPEGIITAFIGPNGAGKSTLIRSMAGLMKPLAGEVLVRDSPLSGMSSMETARLVSVVDQFSQRAEGFTVRDFVCMGSFPFEEFLHLRRHGTSDAEEMMQLCGVAHLSERSLSTLSGGELRLVHIARALVQNRENILMDEPAAGLDINHVMMFADLVRRLNEAGSSVTFSVHDINLAASFAHRIVALRDGKIFFEGTPDSVLTEESVSDLFNVKCSADRHPLTGRPFLWFMP